MSSKLYTSKKKNARIQTPDVSTAPTSGMFESRPFVPQQATTLQSQPDLSNALMQTQRYGHNLSQVNFAEPSASTPTQPKTRSRNPLQSQKVLAAPLQAKLAIGKPGDKYEQEADRMAQQVVSNLHAPTPGQSNSSQNLQREAVPEEDKLQRQPEASVIQREEMPEEQDKLQMKPSAPLQNNEEGLPTSNLEASIQNARGSGQALSNDIRTPMEQAFGADFSGVKVHTDAQSHQINQSIQAKAFTTGHDIFFRQGAYNPHSQQGQQLLAHELTHVVQQNTGVMQRAPLENDGFTLVKNKKKKNQNNQERQEQFTDPVQNAENRLNKWVDDEVQRITRDIENILTNENRDKWGTVPLNNPDYQLLNTTNQKATEYKIKVVERIKELHKKGAPVQYPGWDGVTWYHTTGLGKGAAGFNLTGHGPKGTVFNIHIQ